MMDFTLQQHPALYAAFDTYPSAKGASTHIYHFSQTLFNHTAGGLLYVLGGKKLLSYQKEVEVEILRFDAAIPNFLERAQLYSQHLMEVITTQHQLKICHFRDIWGGQPNLLLQEEKGYKSVFEVNGLPSIELPYRYPLLTESTLKKLREREQLCLRKADYIVVPSEVIQSHLRQRGIAAEKITVITNGADLPQTLEKPVEAPEKYIIYFGALQSWQGVDTLLKAFRLIGDFSDVKLVICASTKPRKLKEYFKFIDKQGLSDRIIWQYQLKKRPLYNWISGALFSVAPLSACSRNVEQGCSPLKILESMALGIPVVASDLPVVREIVSNDRIGKLVRPDRPAELARAMRLLLDYPDLTKKMGKNAKRHIQENFTWESKKQQLIRLYQKAC
ncbi:MAG: glycosyltransferase family 4 protein [Thermonemataceae bacterium]